MASSLFDKARESFISANPSIDLDTDTIKAALVRGYTPSLSTHQFLSDMTGAGGSVVGTAQTLGTKTVTAGVFDAADATFTAVASGAAIPYILIYKDTGSASTSPLIALIDTATGLPVTPNGADISITWDNGASKIFKV